MALFLSRVIRRHASRLIYSEYGVPSEVVRLENFPDPEISGPKDVVVEILAAPIHPADINTIQGKITILGLLLALPIKHTQIWVSNMHTLFVCLFV